MTAQETAPKTRAPIPDLEQLDIEPTPDGDNLDSFGTIKVFKALIPNTGVAGDKFFVEIFGEPGTPEGGKYTSATLLLGATNPRTLNLKKEVVAFLLGKKMTARYTIVRENEDDKSSPDREFNVLPLPKSELKAGRILEAEDNGHGSELDLTGSTADLTLRLEIWPLIAEWQRCWISLEGTKHGDENHKLTVLESEPVDEDWITRGYLEVKVSFSYFAELINGSELKVIVKVAPNQVDDESQAFDFEERFYTVKNVVAAKFEITGMTDSKGSVIANGWATIDTSVKLQGTVLRGGEVDVYDGATPMGRARTSGAQWEFDASGLSVKRYAFIAKVRGGSQPDSKPWDVTVGAPYIGAASVPNGGLSPGETVSLGGPANPGQTVVLYIGGGEAYRETVSSNTWHASNILLPGMFNSFTVGELGATLRSPVWSIRRDLT